MNKKKRYSLLLVCVMMASLVFTGCQKEDQVESNAGDEGQDTEVVETEDTDDEEEIEEEDEDEIVQLSDWDGTWNNMVAYLDDEELEVAFKDLADREEMSIEETKEEFIADRATNFEGLIVDGDKITLLDGFEDKGGEPLKEIEFEYKEVKVVKEGNFETEWFYFESEDDGEYKNLLMMPVHGEEALTHFHLRYGNDLDEILADENWYPTFVKPNSTYEQLYEEVTE